MSDPVRFLTSLSNALSTLGLYGEAHPATRRAADASYRELADLQAGRPGLIFTFMQEEVLFGRDLLPELERWEWSSRLAKGGIERFLADSRRPAELRAIAVRALGRANGPNTLAQLLDIAGTRRHFFGWHIEAKSPVVLAAVSVLASNWGGHPQVVGLLREAREHDDPEIRLAARVRFA